MRVPGRFSLSFPPLSGEGRCEIPRLNRGRGRVRSIDGNAEDMSDNLIEIAADVRVPDPHDFEAKPFEVGVARRIVCRLPPLSVLVPIYLHNRFCPQAGEVEKVAVARNLSAKMQALTLESAPLRPEDHLLRHRFAEAAGALDRHRLSTPETLLRKATLPWQGREKERMALI